MHHRALGHSGLRISALSLGTLTFGSDDSEFGRVSPREVDAMVGAALDGGVTYFDTADVYFAGKSERRLGAALGRRRTEVVVASKVRFRMGPGAHDAGLSRRHVVQACEASLRRLNTDWLDLYYLHGPDPGTPLEETLRALEDLVRAGKVRYLGCSNMEAWRAMRALGLAQAMNLSPLVAYQGYYNPLVRDAEHDIIPFCREQGLGFVAWGPLGGSFFTGLHGPDAPPPPGTRRSHRGAPGLVYYPLDESAGYALVDALREVAGRRGGSVAQAALAYLLTRPGVTSVCFGATRAAQVRENLGCLAWTLDAEEVQRLDALARPRLPYPHWHIAVENPPSADGASNP